MESVANVAKEVEKVLVKFGALNEHAQSTLQSLIESLIKLKDELSGLSGG